MTNSNNRFLAVIDPTRHDQWALRKAVSMAKDRDGAEVYAFLCTWSAKECSDKDELQSVVLRRNMLWLEDVISSYEEQGIEIRPIIAWNQDWREGICEATRDNDIDLVIKKASGRPNALASSDRQLIRTLESALLLIKHDPSRDIKKVLVAVDFNATEAAQMALNESIMDLGCRIRGASEVIKLHSVSAYPDSDKFIHAPDVAKKLGIDRSEVHVREGNAASVIPHFANDIDADLVIVGNVGRRGLSGITIGNTAEKILTDIRSDVLVIVSEDKDEASKSAA